MASVAAFSLLSDVHDTEKTETNNKMKIFFVIKFKIKTIAPKL
jgi:hypothetical protein